MYKAALEAIGDGVLIFDAGGEVVFANEPWRTMFEIPQDWGTEQISRRVAGLTPSVVTDASYELVELNPERLVERFVTPLLNHGDTAGRVVVFRDVTGRLTTDSELRETHRTLDRLTAGYRGVWHAVGTVLRRLIVAQEALRGYTGTGEPAAWELHDAVQLISRHAGVERSRSDRINLAQRSTEISAYLARIGRAAGVEVETVISDELWITTDIDLFVSGVLSALVGFAIAATPDIHQLKISLDREENGPVAVQMAPPLPPSGNEQLGSYDAGRPGALHAALLRAFVVTLGIEISVADVVEIRGV